MKRIDVDPESGAEIYQLTDGPRPADNIYGEQPYASADGTRIAIRFYREGDTDGGLALLDLTDGSLCSVLETAPRFPAFHAWGESLYYQEAVGDRLVLKRCNYRTVETEETLDLTGETDRLSYGTVSPDGRYYAVSARREDRSSYVLSFDLRTGKRLTSIDSTERYFKHEQFALDGSNRILIQANSQDVTTVYLGILSPTAEGVDWLAADRPHTPRPTGHEAWVGATDRVLFSTAIDDRGDPNIWVAGVGDAAPAAVQASHRCSHVSVSRCGNYWIGDVGGEDGVPIYAGSLETGNCRRIVVSGTEHDGEQWSHTHPYLTADNGWLIYTSTRAGHPQVFGAGLPGSLLEDL